MFAGTLMLTLVIGNLRLPLLHGLISFAVPLLLVAAYTAFALLNATTRRRYHQLYASMIRQIAAIRVFGLDQVPVVAAILENSGNREIARAIERLQQDQDVLYQQRWLPDPAREFTLRKLMPDKRLAALDMKPALSLLSIGLIASLITLLLQLQQPVSPVDLSAALPWPPALVGLITALLLGVQSRSIRDQLQADLTDLSVVIAQRVPVFGQQTGMAQLIDSFFNYDRQMVASLDRFNETASRLAESDMADGIRRSVEQVLFEAVAPSLREATTLLGDLATELSQRQEQGMAELAGRFATALSSEIAAHLGPVNRELTQLASTMGDIKNYTDYAVRSLETLKQDASAQQADIQQALQELKAARLSFDRDATSLEQQLARFTDASTRLSETYTTHEQSLAQTLQTTGGLLEADQKVLNETLQRSSEALVASREISAQQQAVLAQLGLVGQSIDQSLTVFAQQSEAYVGRTLGQLDEGLAQVVERLAFATAEIRDAVEALPAVLRQTPNFR